MNSPQNRISHVLISGRHGRITLTLEGSRLTKRMRRQLALVLVQGVHEQLEKVSVPFLEHRDGHWLQWLKEMERGLSFAQAPNLETEMGELGFRIRLARLDLGWTQEELGKRARIPPSTLSRIEHGLRRPRARTLRRITNALDLRLAGENLDGRTGHENGLTRTGPIDLEITAGQADPNGPADTTGRERGDS